MDRPLQIIVSPSGTTITATLEQINARACIVPGSARADAVGGIEFDYDGNTELFWEDQRTVLRDDERVFLDEEGHQFLESQLRLMPETSAAPPAPGNGEDPP